MSDSEHQLIQMIRDAYDACKSENMNCPWCSGHVRYDLEEHDQFCPWPGFLLLYGDPSKPKPEGVIQG